MKKTIEGHISQGLIESIEYKQLRHARFNLYSYYQTWGTAFDKNSIGYEL